MVGPLPPQGDSLLPHGGIRLAGKDISRQNEGGVRADWLSVGTRHWAELAQREQRVLTMRFYGNMTQAEIGDQLGISQMHVSRQLARALAYLRDCLLAPEDGATTAEGG